MDVNKTAIPPVSSLRKAFRVMNRFMVWMWKLGLGNAMNSWPAGFGRIMILRHRGRRSGREYLTPVNYAIVNGEIYCTAGFGARSDWYRNLLANPGVELWLPEGKRAGCAEDISGSPQRLFLVRQVIIASGFAGPLFGVNPHRLDDEQLDAASKDYRLVHFRLEAG